MKRTFLKAAWKKLVMANYEVEPSLLQPYLPRHTKLDFFDGKCYVSLVGFMFEEVRLRGMLIPFHTRFPEVNLRFYVKQSYNADKTRRGVVFIKEIVPKSAIAWVANTIYKEKYIAVPMKNKWLLNDDKLSVEYSWHFGNRWHSMAVSALNRLQPMAVASKEDFIFEHYYGYSRVNDLLTNEYQVMHPAWQTYPLTSYQLDCDFGMVYGKEFAVLNDIEPASVFLAEGSAVSVGDRIKLS
jgi:uncharacterized protein